MAEIDRDETRESMGALQASTIPDSPRRSGAESSRKMLRLLMAFDEVEHTMPAAALAAKAALPASSAYRYLAVLREEGLIEDAGRGYYRLSMNVESLARAANAAVSGMVDAVRPVLQSVVDETGETTLLIRRLGESVVCIDRVESPHPVRLQFQRGSLMSLHLGSSARVLLSGLPHAQRARYLDRVGADRSGVLTDDALDRVAQAGWTESFGEVDDGVWGVAAAIETGDTVIAAIALAGPLFRLTEAPRKRAIAIVRRAALTVSERLVDLN